MTQSKAAWDHPELVEHLRNLQRDLHANSRKHGFWEKDGINDQFTTKIALIVSELGEAVEAHRKDENDDKLTNRPGEECELADALIRILDTAEGLNYDVIGAMIEKASYNTGRPHKHGGRKY